MSEARSARVMGAAVAALVALALPTVALAAAPHKGGHYSQQQGGRFVVNLDVSPNGKTITNFAAFTDCNPAPFKAPLSIQIDRAGAFHLSAVRKDALGDDIHAVISGKFVTRGRARGTYKFSAPGCAGRSVAFSATFQRPG
jgi:hypothetical protein